MRAMFVACCLGLLVSAVASPAHARAFCQFKDCQKTSVQKAARRHTATRVHKLSPKRTAQAPNHTVTHTASAHAPRQTATHTASVHAPRHMATATPKHPLVHSATRSVHATKTRLSPASREVREPRVRFLGTKRWRRKRRLATDTPGHGSRRRQSDWLEPQLVWPVLGDDVGRSRPHGRW